MADLNVSHVEIVSFVPDRAAIIHGVITRLDFSGIGRRTFLVDLVEEDGGRIAMSDRTDYGRAIIDAEELALDCGCVVVDKVAA